MRRTITWVLYIIMGVQIVFGCAYFAGNFSAEQQFAERYASVMPMGIVSLIQLFAAAVSIWYVLGKLGFEGKREKRFLRGYVCAFLLTVPCLLQMHTARLVWSPALSCFLWMLGLVMETAVRGVSKKKVLFLTGAYFLYGVICPDGLWLGGILLFFCLLYRRKRERITENRNKSGKEAGEQREKVPFGLAVFFTAAVFAEILPLTLFPDRSGDLSGKRRAKQRISRGAPDLSGKQSGDGGGIPVRLAEFCIQLFLLGRGSEGGLIGGGCGAALSADRSAGDGVLSGDGGSLRNREGDKAVS